jgi:DNA-directed RNA polymerase specialized sigma24 family protein
MTLNPSSETRPTTANDRFSRRVELVLASFDLHHTYLLNYLRSMAGHHDAEDILQELWKFVVVHFAEDKIDCLPLLRRKAYQLFIDHYRRCKARGILMEKVEREAPPENREYIYDEGEETRLQAKFWQEFPVALSDEQKAVLWHYGRYGLTFQEIEAKLGVKASTACDWVKLGRQQLEPFLNDR